VPGRSSLDLAAHGLILNAVADLDRPAPLAFHSLTQRIALASPALSIPDNLPSTNVRELEESSGSNVALQRMSREDKLTVINFCVTNMCAGCFYSLLGPFYPTEVSSFVVSQSVGLLRSAPTISNCKAAFPLRLRCAAIVNDSERYVAMFPLNKLEICVSLPFSIAHYRSAAVVETGLKTCKCYVNNNNY